MPFDLTLRINGLMLRFLTMGMMLELELMTLEALVLQSEDKLHEQ